MTGWEVFAEMVGAAFGYLVVALAWLIGLTVAAFALGLLLRLLVTLVMAGDAVAEGWL